MDVHRDEATGEADRGDRALARALHRLVDRQHEVVAGGRLALGETPAGRLAGGVDLHAALAVGSAQQAVVGELDPVLADLVAGLERLVARILELLLVDLAGVAEQVRGERALRIAAHVDALDRHPREAVLILAQEVDRVVVDVTAQGRRAGRARLRLGADLVANLVRAQAGDLADAREQPRASLGVLRQVGLLDLQLERGAVVDQDLAAAVEHLAARRLHGELADLVVLGLREVVVAGEHLQVPEAQEDDHERHQADPAEDRDPQREPLRHRRPAPVGAHHHETPPWTAERRRRRGRRSGRVRCGGSPAGSIALVRRVRLRRSRTGTSARLGGV